MSLEQVSLEVTSPALSTHFLRGGKRTVWLSRNIIILKGPETKTFPGSSQLGFPSPSQPQRPQACPPKQAPSPSSRPRFGVLQQPACPPGAEDPQACQHLPGGADARQPGAGVHGGDLRPGGSPRDFQKRGQHGKAAHSLSAQVEARGPGWAKG